MRINLSHQKFIIKIECSDEIGLVNRITGVLREHGINIIRNDEFVQRDAQRFFMRTYCEGGSDLQNLEVELKSVLPENSTLSISPKRKKSIVIMVTKEPYCVGDLLVRCLYGDTHADIKAVVGNHEDLRSLVEGFGIPFHCIPAAGLSREEHEAQVMKQLDQYSFEYLVLAKYMRILSSDFTSRYANKIINIHHSFLPAFIGANPYLQAYQRGVKIIGATAHFVTEDLDEGPIIAQDVIHVDHSQSWQDLASAGRALEKTVLTRAINLVLDDKVFVDSNKTVVFR